MRTIKAFGTTAASEPLKPMDIVRREVGLKDIKIAITHCGVCHSDIHTARNEWNNSKYPVVPGHEIIGKVIGVGADVTQFKEGDLVGVGCLVDSCHHCPPCNRHLEQFCEKGATFTYNSHDKHIKGQQTYGGYATEVVVDEQFVLRIPKNIDPAAAAPLLCAGITTWSPLRHWKVKKGDKVGVVGLGGLGHMGVKFANALGAKVVMITTSPEKAKDAKSLGAHEVLISKNKEEMAAHNNSFDFILNTIPVGHEMDPYIGLLKIDATMVLVGAVENLKPFHGGGIIGGRKRIAGSLIGGIKETQEMLDFCGEHNIVSDIELINMQDINNAYDRVIKSDVKYRFVIDMESLKD
ncbi:NAD(P)-dependent alcohol dehydrogenase [Arenibacter latericius]|uniref:NAD(P)-dependent alcohol dehydrogenase n=1 Tax=Arenibacter latericius TaxID=86104 RepID=UPI000402F201|nr:NAD(P)-dependent alcohol dehydrogenase [Arenibacter latericius]